MQAAAKATEGEAEKLKIKKPLILGVTLLTSFDEQMLKETGVSKQIDDYVLYLAQEIKKAGLDGVVASPQELRFLRENLGESFIMVTPGIRFPRASSGEDDQKRIATPNEAIKNGADYIGVGPIFSTQTKKNVKQSKGLEYLKWVSDHIKIPHVAIGGIKESNIKQVKEHGGTCFAMISEIIGSDDIGIKVEKIRKKLNGERD